MWIHNAIVDALGVVNNFKGKILKRQLRKNSVVYL